MGLWEKYLGGPMIKRYFFVDGKNAFFGARKK